MWRIVAGLLTFSALVTAVEPSKSLVPFLGIFELGSPKYRTESLPPPDGYSTVPARENGKLSTGRVAPDPAAPGSPDG